MGRKVIEIFYKNLEAIWTEGLNTIVWSANDICPFKCWYCPENVWGGSGKTPYTWAQCSDFLDIVSKRIPSCAIHFTGGEPTDWPLFPKILDKIYTSDSFNWYVLVISNMSKSKGFIDEWIDNTHQVCASYHPNVIDTFKKRDAWFEKVLSFKHRTNMHIRLLMDPKHWDHCLEVFERLNDPNIILEPVAVLNYLDGHADPRNTHDQRNGKSSPFAKEYTSEQHEILNKLKSKLGSLFIKKWEAAAKDHPAEIMLEYSDGDSQTIKGAEAPTVTQQIMSSGINKFGGWHCEIGIKDLFISPLGQVGGAVCRAHEGKYIGNINDIDNIEWPEKAMVCPYEHCLCGTDVTISKYKL